LKNLLYCLDDTVYDVVDIDSPQVRLFVEPISTGKTVNETNLRTSGRIPLGWLRIESVRLIFLNADGVPLDCQDPLWYDTVFEFFLEQRTCFSIGSFVLMDPAVKYWSTWEQLDVWQRRRLESSKVQWLESPVYLSWEQSFGARCLVKPSAVVPAGTRLLAILDGMGCDLPEAYGSQRAVDGSVA
jgi:hypothetical protein